MRKVIGYELSPEEKLLDALLDERATDRENAVDPARLTDDEGLVETLERHEHLKRAEGGEIYLSEMGRTVAEGARKTGRS